MEKSKLINIVILIIGIIFGVYIGSIIIINNIKPNKFIDIDTTYNKITLDSIEYNINKKDSFIIEFKKKFEYEKEQVLNASDSANIELFKQLAGSR